MFMNSHLFLACLYWCQVCWTPRYGGGWGYEHLAATFLAAWVKASMRAKRSVGAVAFAVCLGGVLGMQFGIYGHGALGPI